MSTRLMHLIVVAILLFGPDVAVAQDAKSKRLKRSQKQNKTLTPPQTKMPTPKTADQLKLEHENHQYNIEIDRYNAEIAKLKADLMSSMQTDAFDHYVVSIRWAPKYKKYRSEKDSNPTTESHMFMLHGLWKADVFGESINTPVTKRRDSITAYNVLNERYESRQQGEAFLGLERTPSIVDLFTYWPKYEFESIAKPCNDLWKHEYAEHSPTYMTSSEYMTTAISILKKESNGVTFQMRLKNAFKNIYLGEHRRGWPVEKDKAQKNHIPFVLKAIEEVTGVSGSVSDMRCDLSFDHAYQKFKEVHICVNKENLEFMACPRNYALREKSDVKKTDKFKNTKTRRCVNNHPMEFQ